MSSTASADGCGAPAGGVSVSAATGTQAVVEGRVTREGTPVSTGYARLLGTGKVGGRTVWHVSFFDPATPSWFEASIDQKTYRTLELDMTAASHFMHDVYGPFNASMRLHAPK